MYQNNSVECQDKKSYWRVALSNLYNVRILVLAALFIAIRVALKTIYIPLGENLNIYIGFLVNALSGAICGPIVALVSGCVSDILGFLIHPDGAFMPLFTLIEMLGSFIYSVWLFRKKITIWKIVGAKVSVNVLVNIVANSLALSLLYGKGVMVYVIPRIVKNVIVLPLEILLLSIFFVALHKPISKIKVFGDLNVDIKVNKIALIISFVFAIAFLVLILCFYNEINDAVKTFLKQLFNMN